MKTKLLERLSAQGMKTANLESYKSMFGGKCFLLREPGREEVEVATQKAAHASWLKNWKDMV